MAVMFARGIDTLPVGADCKNCGLCERPIVLGLGPDQADLVIVGEAPGETEVTTGRPFVGRAGGVLNDALRAAGIDRMAAFVTNAVLCRPEGNRTPEPSEVRACNGRLLAEVLGRRPRFVLALGAVAYKALTGKGNAIGSVRGVMTRWQGNTMLMATWHPAYILRNPAAFVDLQADLKLLAAFMAGQEQMQDQADVTHRVAESLADVHVTTRDLGREVVVDVETASDGSLLCIGLADVDASEAFIIPKALIPGVNMIFTRQLAGKIIIGHNFKFDARVLWRHGIDVKIGRDTHLMAYLLDERIGDKDLEFLCHQRLGVPDWKAPVAEARKGNHMETIEPEVLHGYNAHDVIYNARLYKDMMAQLPEESLRLLDEHLMPAANVLARMEETGVLVDQEELLRLRANLDDRCNESKTTMAELVGRDINPNSWQQVAKALYGDLELPEPLRGSKTDEHVLEALTTLPDKSEAATQFLTALQGYRKLDKMRGTYVKGIQKYLGEDGRLRAQFNLHTTVTGRLSSSKPNMQNVPKHDEEAKPIRQLYVASPGYTLVECDLSQAELRVLAALSGDPNLIEALQGDPHAGTAAMIYGCKVSEVTPAQRQIGKTCNFAVVYGAEAQKVATATKCSLAEAADIIQRLRAAYRVAMEWFDQNVAESIARGYTITPFGRKRHFPYVPKYGPERAALIRELNNTPIQSTASDICLRAVTRIGEQIDWVLTRLLLTVHDSIMAETREDYREVARMMMAEMTKTPFANVPFFADASYGERWGSLQKLEVA